MSISFIELCTSCKQTNYNFLFAYHIISDTSIMLTLHILKDIIDQFLNSHTTAFVF